MYLIASTAGNSIVVNTKEEWTGIELGVGSNLYFFLTENKLPSFKGQMSFLLVVFWLSSHKNIFAVTNGSINPRSVSKDNFCNKCYTYIFYYISDLILLDL